MTDALPPGAAAGPAAAGDPAAVRVAILSDTHG